MLIPRQPLDSCSSGRAFRHTVVNMLNLLFVVHTPVPATVTPHTAVPDTPSSALELKATNGSSGTGTNTPTSVKDGNLYLECVNCSRQVRLPTFCVVRLNSQVTHPQVASNRYAPHLSNCMGLASARRGAVRGNAKSKYVANSMCS